MTESSRISIKAQRRRGAWTVLRPLDSNKVTSNYTAYRLCDRTPPIRDNEDVRRSCELSLYNRQGWAYVVRRRVGISIAGQIKERLENFDTVATMICRERREV
jgi:hypothetical protein